MSTVKHILGISGGKDSAALSIYLNEKHPELDVEYYTSDTGRELDETYALIDRLESKLGKKIFKLDAVDLTNIADQNAFDHFLSMYGGSLPSSTSRWCTKQFLTLVLEEMKIEMVIFPRNKAFNQYFHLDGIFGAKM